MHFLDSRTTADGDVIPGFVTACIDNPYCGDCEDMDESGQPRELFVNVWTTHGPGRKKNPVGVSYCHLEWKDDSPTMPRTARPLKKITNRKNCLFPSSQAPPREPRLEPAAGASSTNLPAPVVAPPELCVLPGDEGGEARRPVSSSESPEAPKRRKPTGSDVSSGDFGDTSKVTVHSHSHSHYGDSVPGSPEFVQSRVVQDLDADDITRIRDAAERDSIAGEDPNQVLDSIRTVGGVPHYHSGNRRCFKWREDLAQLFPEDGTSRGSAPVAEAIGMQDVEPETVGEAPLRIPANGENLQMPGTGELYGIPGGVASPDPSAPVTPPATVESTPPLAELRSTLQPSVPSHEPSAGAAWKLTVEVKTDGGLIEVSLSEDAVSYTHLTLPTILLV